MSLGCSFNLHLFLRFVPFSIHFVPRFLHFRLFCHLYTPALNPHFTYQPSSSLQVRISLFVDKGWPVVNEVEYTSGGLEVVPVPIARGLFSGWRATTISCPKWPLDTWCLFINLGLGAGAAVVEALQAIADLRAEFP